MDKKATKRRKGVQQARKDLKRPKKFNTSKNMWEEKQKGIDGKVCWDGYKRMGTKKKGGKTVDNCVKAEDYVIDAIENYYLTELSPKTISSYQKKAGAQYRQLRKDGPTKRQDVENAYHQGYTSDKEYNKQHDNITKMKKRGRGLAASKGKGLQKEGAMKRMATDKEESKRLSASKGTFPGNDMATFKKKPKPVKEENIFEISDALKKRYMAKAGKEVSDKEHMKDYLQRQMDKSNKKTPGTFSGMNKKFVDDKYDKETLKRRKGMAKARAGLKEENKPTNPGLWSKAKAAARSKFDVYPSAYANGWAVQWYKKRGGGWKKVAKEEVELQELSPKTISSYQKKAGKQYSDLKKSTMSATSREGGYHKGYISQKEYDAQHDMADKKARRGKGLAMSKGKGVQKEGAMKRLATDAAEKKRLLKIKTNKPIKTKVTDIGPGGKEYVRKDWSEQKQIVTNLDLDESIANLVKRGVGRVKDTLQQAGQQYVDHQKKQMKAGKGIYSNPVSGDNIRKRREQMQKKRLTK